MHKEFCLFVPNSRWFNEDVSWLSFSKSYKPFHLQSNDSPWPHFSLQGGDLWHVLRGCCSSECKLGFTVELCMTLLAWTLSQAFICMGWLLRGQCCVLPKGVGRFSWMCLAMGQDGMPWILHLDPWTRFECQRSKRVRQLKGVVFKGLSGRVWLKDGHCPHHGTYIAITLTAGNFGHIQG